MDKRTEYVEKLSAQMVEWDAQIDGLKNKAEGAMPEVKFEYNKTIATLQLKRDEAAVNCKVFQPQMMMNGKTSRQERNESGARSGLSYTTLS
jgi:hypothetical protein